MWQSGGAPPLVEIDDLACGYGGRPVLERLALRLDRGQFAGIVGPSGSGKTTVLRAILGQAEVYHGAVRFPAATGRRPRVGYVPQLETIDWSFPVTVEQVVLMGLAAESGPFPWARKADRARMHALLERLGIGACARRHIRDLSGGQQQRVFLARALVQEARVYLMDEPFAAVDAATERAIVDILRELRDRGRTALVVHHDLHTVPEYFDHVILINMRVVAHGPTEEVFTRENLQKTYGGRLTLLDEAAEALAR